MHWLDIVSNASDLRPRGERAFSIWRTYADAFVILYISTCVYAPGAYWLLKSALCDHDLSTTSTFASALAADPLLNSFPCEFAYRNSSTPTGLMLFNALSSLKQEPQEMVSWFMSRWWWLSTYVYGRYRKVDNFGGATLFLPFFVLLIPLCTRWYIEGGRTLLVMSCRVVSAIWTIDNLWFHRELVDPYVYLSDAKWALHTMLCRTVLGVVQWRLQVPIVVFEIIASVFARVANVGFSPPSFLWLVQLVTAAIIGAVIGLVINLCETCTVLRLVPASWMAEDSSALGPIHALRLAGQGMMHGGVSGWEYLEQTTEFVVFAVLLAACVVVLTVRDDIVLVF